MGNKYSFVVLIDHDRRKNIYNLFIDYVAIRISKEKYDELCKKFEGEGYELNSSYSDGYPISFFHTELDKKAVV